MIQAKILVTAGPTVEPLDPIRFISNHSTGALGYEIAKEASKRGFKVCLVSGPVHIVPPSGVEVVNVQTARQMRQEVIKRVDGCNCLIMTAAVCDFRPKLERKEKIKKSNKLNIRFIENPDILSELRDRRRLVKIGFALETNDPIGYGRDKLREKKLDLIVINQASKRLNPFGPDARVSYTVVDKNNNIEKYNLLSKKAFSRILVKKAARWVKQKRDE